MASAALGGTPLVGVLGPLTRWLEVSKSPLSQFLIKYQSGLVPTKAGVSPLDLFPSPSPFEFLPNLFYSVSKISVFGNTWPPLAICPSDFD